MSEGLLGVIIGAIAAIVGGIIGEMLTHHYSRQETLYKEKMAAYEGVEHILFEVCVGSNRLNNYCLTDDYRHKFNTTTTKLALYAPDHISVLFTKVYTLLDSGDAEGARHQEYEDACGKLLLEMRKDLGIKEEPNKSH